jgi:glycosyltransferase 2 family protein
MPWWQRMRSILAKPPNSRPWLRPVWLVVRLALVLGLLWWVVARNGHGRILETVLAARAGWLMVGATLFFISIVLGAWQWHLLLRWQGISLDFKQTFRTYYVGLFLNNFLPGTVGGDVVRVVETRRAAAGWGKAAAATLLDRLLGFAALSVLAWLALLLEHFRGTLATGVFVHLFKAVTLITASFVAILILLLSRRVSAAIHSLVRKTPWRKLDDAYARLQDVVTAYRRQWSRMGGVFLIALGVQVLRVAVHWTAGIALGLSIAPAFYFCFIPIMALAGVVPLNVGGWGIPQSLGAYLYALPGVLPAGLPDAAASAAALAFLPSVLGFVVMLGGGFYLVLGRSPQDAANPSSH